MQVLFVLSPGREKGVILACYNLSFDVFLRYSNFFEEAIADFKFN